jgi:hypothetical protein
MALSKKNRSAMLAKSPPRLLIRPITKRLRQKTPKASSSLPLSLRLTKLTFTSTLITFNSSQINKSEFEEERRVQVISESESKESKEEKDNNTTYANKFLDQDLKKLGLDKLNKSVNNRLKG